MDRKCPSKIQRWDSPLWWRLLWTSSGTPAGRRAARPWSPWQQQILTPPSTPLSEILWLAPHTASVMWTLSEGGTHTLSLSLSAAHTHLIPPSLPPPPLRLRRPDLLRSVDMLLLWRGVIKPKFGKVDISMSWHKTIRSNLRVRLNCLWQHKSSPMKITADLGIIAGHQALVLIALWDICHHAINSAH